MRVPPVLGRSPFLARAFHFQPRSPPSLPILHTEDDWGQLGVYRVFFAVAVFHALLALIMIGVKSSRDVRASLQNGMWAIKLLVLVGLMVGAFFIHNSFYIGACWGRGKGQGRRGKRRGAWLRSKSSWPVVKPLFCLRFRPRAHSSQPHPLPVQPGAGSALWAPSSS